MVARGRDALERAAAEIGGEAFPADITDPAEVERLADRFVSVTGGVPDILVNSAGAFTLATFAETAPGAFQAQLAANLTGPFLLVRAFLTGMVSRGSGHVVNLGSIAGRVPLAGNAAYGASKFGLHGLHAILAEELRGTGIRTSLVEPAATDTPLWDPLDPDSRDDLPSRSAMLRAQDVARAILYVLEQPPGVEVTHLSIRATT
jgi:NAD(P)-dependent dehydrogenase (short-subunit alcohol dehydrogenase family)